MPKVCVAIADGEKVRELRIAAGLSTAELGRKLKPKRTSQTIRNIESGERVSEKIVVQVARALRVSADDVIQQRIDPFQAGALAAARDISDGDIPGTQAFHRAAAAVIAAGIESAPGAAA